VLRAGDQLTVHALPLPPGDAAIDISEYAVVRDLPDPSTMTQGWRRVMRPAVLTVGRSRARTRLVARGFDVAHIGNLVYQTDWADLARLRGRVAIVADVHDVRPHHRSLPPRVETALLRRTYANADRLIVLHDVLKQEIVADFGVDAERVHVVPHVLDLAGCRDPSTPAPPRPVFLLFGTMRSNKGIEVLADAIGALGPDFDADVVMAGAADDQTTKMLTDRLGSYPNVSLEFGRVTPERKRELFSGASWTLLPYMSFHSQSGVLADAYTYRVPLVVSDVGAIGPTVRDDGTGFVVPPGDSAALATAMERAVQAPAGGFADGLDRAARRHDVSVVGPMLRDIYEQAAAARS
jgi:glycosyltransferase involved in cell wall biosynthesis